MRARVDFTDDAGVTRQLETDERHYLPSELTWYMHTLGMRNTSVFGCTVGDFRKCPPTPEHFELLVLAEKGRQEAAWQPGGKSTAPLWQA